MSRPHSKVCSRCQIDQPIEKYYRRDDGYYGTCRSCIRERNRIAVRRYKQTTKGRQRQREADNKYKQTENGRLVCLEHSRKRKERKCGLDGSFTHADHQFVISLFESKCFNCSTCDDLQIDHHHPLSKGHALTRENAVVLCEACNTRKYNKHPREFYTDAQLLELEQRYGIATA